MYVEDTIGVNIEGDFNLGDTTWSGRDASEVEFTEEMAVLGLGTLTLEDLDGYSRLLVSISCEGLGLLGWDSCVSGDKSGHDTTGSLNSLGERSNIDKEDILELFVVLSTENGGLDSGTEGDGFIRVD